MTRETVVYKSELLQIKVEDETGTLLGIIEVASNRDRDWVNFEVCQTADRFDHVQALAWCSGLPVLRFKHPTPDGKCNIAVEFSTQAYQDSLNPAIQKADGGADEGDH